MDLYSRLAELLQTGNRTAAIALAKEALSNDPLTTITVTATTARITTPSFTGTHDVTLSPPERAACSATGSYTLTADTDHDHDNDLDLSFTLHTIPDAAEATIRVALVNLVHHRTQQLAATDTTPATPTTPADPAASADTTLDAPVTVQLGTDCRTYDSLDGIRPDCTIDGRTITMDTSPGVDPELTRTLTSRPRTAAAGEDRNASTAASPTAPATTADPDRTQSSPDAERGDASVRDRVARVSTWLTDTGR